MLKFMRLTAALSTAAISLLPWFPTPVIAQTLDEDPKIEFTSIQVRDNRASGSITNWSNQKVIVDRVNVIAKNQSIQIVASLYLEPGQTIKFRNAQLAGSSTNAWGYVQDITSWLDENRYGHHSNFLMCKYITGSGAEGSYSMDREKVCKPK